jgi:LysM repeat protein
VGFLDNRRAPKKETRPSASGPSTSGSAPLPEPEPGPTVAEAASETVLAPRARIHTVAAGDTLEGIARQYSVDPADVRRLNALGERDQVVEGQVFTIPAG